MTSKKFSFSLGIVEKRAKQKLKILKEKLQEINIERESLSSEENELRLSKSKIDHYLTITRQKGEFSKEEFWEKQLCALAKEAIRQNEKREGIESVFQKRCEDLLAALKEKNRLKKLKEKRYAKWQKKERSSEFR